MSLLLGGEPEEHARDLAIYRTCSWSGLLAGVRVREVPNCRVASLERMLAEEAAPAVILPGAIEGPAGLAHICSVAARRVGATPVGIGPGDAGRLLRRPLSAALADAASREPAASTPQLAADYILADFSRYGLQSGVAARGRLLSIFENVEAVHDLPVVWPAELRLSLDILDWLRVASEARLILTDRSYVQTVACLLGVPCVTLLERSSVPETIAVGANLLAGSGADEIQRSVGIMARKVSLWDDPWAGPRDG